MSDDHVSAVLQDEGLKIAVENINGLHAFRADTQHRLNPSPFVTVERALVALQALNEKAVTKTAKIMQLQVIERALRSAAESTRAEMAALVTEIDAVDESESRVVRDNIGLAHWDEFNARIKAAEIVEEAKKDKRARKVARAGEGATARRSPRRRRREDEYDVDADAEAQRAITGSNE